MMRRSTNGESILREIIVLLAVVFLSCSATHAEERLRITINDTVGLQGEQTAIEVFLTNPVDEIVALDIHLVLARSDVANFMVETESGQLKVEFDTVGTLLSGCQFVSARSVSTGDLGLDVRLTAIPQWSNPAHNLMPQGNGVLIRFPVILQSVPSVPPDGITADVFIDVAYKPWFSFTTPTGESIGWVMESIPDTNFYMCDTWTDPPDEVCLSWQQVPQWECPEGECDSIAIVMVDVAVLDETQVNLIPGSVTMVTTNPNICGDVNGDGQLTIGDISIIIGHLFIDRLPILPIEIGNVNCSTERPVVLTIGDISVLIDRLFISQTPLCCEEQGSIE